MTPNPQESEGRMKPFDRKDPDETMGRARERALAEKIATAQMNMLRVRLRELANDH